MKSKTPVRGHTLILTHVVLITLPELSTKAVDLPLRSNIQSMWAMWVNTATANATSSLLCILAGGVRSPANPRTISQFGWELHLEILPFQCLC